jgi:hypothetical protein
MRNKYSITKIQTHDGYILKSQKYRHKRNRYPILTINCFSPTPLGAWFLAFFRTSSSSVSKSSRVSMNDLIEYITDNACPRNFL